MKRGKQAQFYIIAAVIIIIAIISMAGVSNYIITKEEPKDFYDLGENLGLEGAFVIDEGLYNDADIDEKVEDFTSKYADYIKETGEDFELVIAYGNRETGQAKKYKRTAAGEDCLGDYCVPNYEVEEVSLGSLSANTQFVIGENIYNFDIGQNENFLFVLTTSKGFEKYITQNIES